MRPLVFAVAGYNLAETGRMLEIATAARKHFDIQFMSYGGQFEDLIRARGFALKEMEPRLTQKKLARLRKVLSGETLNTVGYLSASELPPRVEAEISLFEEIKPAAVLTGWCLSVTISSEAAQVPFINVLHTTSIYARVVFAEIAGLTETAGLGNGGRCKPIGCVGWAELPRQPRTMMPATTAWESTPTTHRASKANPTTAPAEITRTRRSRCLTRSKKSWG